MERQNDAEDLDLILRISKCCGPRMLNLLWASAAAFFRGVCDVLALHRVLLLVLKSGKESAVVRQRIVRTSAPTCRLGYLRGLQIANFSFEVRTLNFRIIIVGHDL